MSCSVLKGGAGWRRGFCYSGASWVLGGENTACCVCFLSVLLMVVFFSLCHSGKLFSSQPMSFCLFSFWFSYPSHWGGGRSETVTVWFFVANWGKITTVFRTSNFCFKDMDATSSSGRSNHQIYLVHCTYISKICCQRYCPGPSGFRVLIFMRSFSIIRWCSWNFLEH